MSKFEHIYIYAIEGKRPINNIPTWADSTYIIVHYRHSEAIVANISKSDWNEDHENMILMALDNCGDEFVKTVQQAVNAGACAIIGNTYLMAKKFEALVMRTNDGCIKPKKKS